MNPETIKNFVTIAVSIGTLLGGFYAVVTRPLIRIFTLEIEKLRLEVKAELSNMELRLNDRIDTRLVRH